MHLTASEVITALGLAPHPEGGYYRETFRSSLHVASGSAAAARAASTGIYYLLKAGEFSAFHRVSGADELWHHHAGDALELHTIDAAGEHRVTVLGSDLAAGQRPQAVVPAGVLQAAVVRGDAFALCGCTVAPGFEFADFVLPARAELLARHPGLASVIARLTRE